VHRLREYNVLVDGELYKVEFMTHIEGPIFSAKVNEKPHNAEMLGEIRKEAPFSIKIGGKAYEVELKRIDRGKPFIIKVNGKPFSVELKPMTRKLVSKTLESPALASSAKSSRKTVLKGAVTSPMAGKIVSILVKEGDPVKAGDVLCILEAMKMENEITASKAGIVQEVKISEGMSVNERQVLFIVE
jgi:biotin carboxyl carrier protein